MIITNLTPAGFTYLAKLYEHAVSEGMNVSQIHTYLTRKGVAVTKAEVIDHLDNVFTYHGYAAANPAQRPISYAEADAALRKPARRLPAEKTIQLVNEKTGVYN